MKFPIGFRSENPVPQAPDCYEANKGITSKPVKSLEILERLKAISNGEPILYYDFKNGIRYKADTDHCTYWTEIANALDEQFCPIPEDQLTSKQRDGKEQLPASPPFFPISRNRLLERARNWMEINTVELDELDEYLRDHWKQIGLTVLAWGCAMQPLRA